ARSRSNDALVDRYSGFDDRPYPCCCLRMADNRLDRGHSTASFAHGAAFLKDSGNGQQLSTVANRCARAMPLDEIKSTRVNAGLRVCPAQSQSLSFHAWGGNAAFPVRRHAPSIQDSIDL